MTVGGRVVVLLVLVAPVVALAVVLFLARVEQSLPEEDQPRDAEGSRQVDPARHPSA